MALDGLVIHSLVNELSSKLVGGKIDKIHQPESDEIFLHIRNNKENFRLVISASASNPRVYISSNYKKENPIKAPMFCMICRKYLQGGIITGISQVGFERIIKISIESYDELKEKTTKNIFVEIMGRHSNIIITSDTSNKIIDSIKRIPPSVSRVRQVLPNQDYVLAPSQDKLNPLDKVSLDEFKNILLTCNLNTFKSIYTSFLGISPIISKEICYRSNIDPNVSIHEIKDEEFIHLYDTFSLLFRQIGEDSYSPCIITNDKVDKVIDFSCISLTQFEDMTMTNYDSISYTLETYYQSKDMKDRIHQRSSDFKKSISIKLDRLINKLKKQEKELSDTNNADIYKVKGELITSYIYMIKKGMKDVEVSNFYDPDYSNVTIVLNENLTPSENAQKYFKRYNKLKNAKRELTEQIKITKEEVDYLENIMLSIENCDNLNELEDIKDELRKIGYIKQTKKNNKPNKESKLTTSPNEFISTDGFKILVGKNNKQNDYLTLKLADSNDIWMHTKDIPGSHVIIRCNNNEVSETALYEGAMLAAFFSKSKMSSQVPVDYTKKKNIKKPNGAKPGMVIYETNNTIYVTPSEELVTKLKPK